MSGEKGERILIGDHVYYYSGMIGYAHFHPASIQIYGTVDHFENSRHGTIALLKDWSSRSPNGRRNGTGDNMRDVEVENLRKVD